jgi:glycosyltransferase involved in cell wall biosynthesis
MPSIAVHMLARDAEDFIGICLESVLPYVTRVLVTLDARSVDFTEKILLNLSKKYKNLEVLIAPVAVPETDLVRLRNEQIANTKEDWVWIVDSDEYYPLPTVQEVLQEIDSNYDVLALNSWALWNWEEYHVSTTRIPSARVFKNVYGLRWVGTFGKEILYAGYVKLWDKDDKREEVKLLESYYIHFTHMKKNIWRKEMNQLRCADNRQLRRLPVEVLQELKKINEKMQNL